jgi:hypothetical protein
LQLERLEADTTEDEIAAERMVAVITNVSFEHRRPGPKPILKHLPRERQAIETPEQCACCYWAWIVRTG